MVPQVSNPIVVCESENEMALCEIQKTKFTYKQQLYTRVGKAAIGDKITNAFNRTHWQEETNHISIRRLSITNIEHVYNVPCQRQ